MRLGTLGYSWGPSLPKRLPLDTTTRIIDAEVDFEEGFVGDKNLLVRNAQEIPDWWLDENKAEKAASTSAPTGNFHRFARIPAVVFEQWMKEGYDPAREPASKTMAKLQAAGLDYFITTGKRL